MWILGITLVGVGSLAFAMAGASGATTGTSPPTPVAPPEDLGFRLKLRFVNPIPIVEDPKSTLTRVEIEFEWSKGTEDQSYEASEIKFRLLDSEGADTDILVVYTLFGSLSIRSPGVTLIHEFFLPNGSLKSGESYSLLAILRNKFAIIPISVK